MARSTEALVAAPVGLPRLVADTERTNRVLAAHIAPVSVRRPDSAAGGLST